MLPAALVQNATHMPMPPSPTPIRNAGRMTSAMAGRLWPARRPKTTNACPCASPTQNTTGSMSLDSPAAMSFCDDQQTTERRAGQSPADQRCRHCRLAQQSPPGRRLLSLLHQGKIRRQTTRRPARHCPLSSHERILRVRPGLPN
ncbi:MAG: hypothetical protein ACOX6W_06145 [Lentisphaeria bacterium]